MGPEFKHCKRYLENREVELSGKPIVEHHQKMAMVLNRYATGDWIGAWGKWIKDSKITLYQLDKLIEYAEGLERKGKANACGFIRNRLQNKDWHRWGI
jgi:hypothetical protein